MLKTQPVMDLFRRAETAVRKRIRRDRKKAPEELRPLLRHLEDTFYDPDLDTNALEREGLADRTVRQRFSEVMKTGVKAYLLDLKADLAGRLLAGTHLQVRHVAVLLGYSQSPGPKGAPS